MMTSPTQQSNGVYDTVKTRRRNPRLTLPVPSSSSDEFEEPGQNNEAGVPSVPPSYSSGQPGTSAPRIANGQVKIRNMYTNNRNNAGTSSNPNPTGTTNPNCNPAGIPTGKERAKKKRDETKRRHKWSREDNSTLMKVYFQSDPDRTGYRKRMCSLWQDEEMPFFTEQRLADQVKSVKDHVLSTETMPDSQPSRAEARSFLTDIELAELMIRWKPEPQASKPSRKNKAVKKTLREHPVIDLTHLATLREEAAAEDGDRPAGERARLAEDGESSAEERERPEEGEELEDLEDEELPTLTQAIASLRRVSRTASAPEQEDSSQPPAPSYPTTPETLTAFQVALRNKMLSLRASPDTIEVKALRHIDRKKLASLTEDVNKAFATIPTYNITETNTLLKAAAHAVREELGEKVYPPPSSVKRDPWWKRRIEEKIAQDRSDISQLEEIKKGRTLKKKITDGLNRRHPLLKKKGLPCVIEELKQRLRAKAAKIKRYTRRCENFKQNRLFQTNQRQFYRNLNSSSEAGATSAHQEMDKDKCLKFWKDLWTDEATHNEDAPWISEIREELEQKMEEQQQDLEIGKAHVTQKVKKMANWSTAGTDGLHVYWLKHVTSAHERIGSQLSDCLANSSIPAWMTEGKTHLLIKDHAKGPQPGNMRPITCLPAMWKLLTGIVADSMYRHLDSNHLLPTQQKGCKKNSRGCKEQLMIDKLILKNCKRRKQSLHMCFIDYKKAYDKVPHSWILESMKMCGIAPNIVSLFQTSLSQSRVSLFHGKDSLGTVLIKRGIFQGDSVSPLHFIIGLIPLSMILEKNPAGYPLSPGGPKINHRLYMDDLKLYAKTHKDLEELIAVTHSFSADICMEFGIEKCATLKMEKGKKREGIGVTLPTGEVLKDLAEEGYRYLGILESDVIHHKEMKKLVAAEYYRRVKKVVKSGLHGKHTFQAINTWAVPVARYGAGIISWTQAELKAMDVKTRKLLNQHRAHHTQGDVDRLYVSRQQGGRGLQSIFEVVIREQNAMTTFFTESTDPELVTLRPYFETEKLLKGIVIDKKEDKQNDEEKRKTSWTGKIMHGQYARDIVEAGADVEETWSWLHQQDLKKETEGLIIAAQDQALRTNYIKFRIDKTATSPMCRLCHNKNETIDHVLSGCPKLSQAEYKSRHDNVAAAIHWSMCRKYQIECKDKWYEHRAEKVAENDEVKLLWDFHMQTDHVIEARRPDIVLVKKKEATAVIVDIAVPGDTRIKTREQDKILKYQDLKREIKKLWNLKSVMVVPIVVGALGAVTPNLRKHLDSVDCNLSISNIQKTALLGSARILRMVLDI